MHIFNRQNLETMFARVGFNIAWWDYGDDAFAVEDEPEKATNLLYLLRQAAGHAESTADAIQKRSQDF
jgi:hypothetical protein